MRILISGDKHLGLVSDGMERLEEQERVLGGIVEVLRRERPDVYVDLGDLFHNSRPTPAVYEVAMRYFVEVAEWASRTSGRAFLLVGNHDHPTRGLSHALDPFVPLEGYFDRVSVEEWVSSHRVEDHLLVFLPHVTDDRALRREAGSAEEYLEESSKEILKKADLPIVVFSHLEVPGVKLGEFDPVQRDTGVSIPARLIKSKKVIRVYAGHVHKHQEVGKVNVVGSSIHVDFGEADDPKGMILAEV